MFFMSVKSGGLVSTTRKGLTQLPYCGKAESTVNTLGFRKTLSHYLKYSDIRAVATDVEN